MSGAAAAPLPTTLEGWRTCEAELRKSREKAENEGHGLARQRQDAALAAARGDAAAQRRIARLVDREGSLRLTVANLDQGLLVAAQAIGTLEARGHQDARAADLSSYQGKLADRLALVAGIERSFRDIAPLLNQLAVKTREIDETHLALGGARPILPPLAQEAVGGRLAEFLAGCGFGDWLPVLRPEVRPAITSWHEAEQAVQDSYRLADQA